MVTTETRRLVSGGSPDNKFPIPEKDYFQTEFLPDSRLTEVGEELARQKFPSLSGAVTINFLWKGKGGKSGNKAALGKCIKNSGLARFYAQETDYTIWIAADYARAYALTNWQMEALLFHELCHINLEETEDEEAPPIKSTIGHDAEVFYAELEQYGLWMQDLERLGEVVQPALPFDVIRNESLRGTRAFHDEVRDFLHETVGAEKVQENVTIVPGKS